MAKTNAERQAAWRVRRAQQVHATTQRLEAQLEDLKQRLAQALDENEVLRAQLAEAIVPKRPGVAATTSPGFSGPLRAGHGASE
jgi:hypothetical protein